MVEHATNPAPGADSPAASEVVESIIRRVGESASARTIFGEPVSAHGRTVIPVARSAFGFGGGAGRGLAHAHRGAAPVTLSEAEDRPEGSGGGGGGLILPYGYIEISAEGTRFVRFNAFWHNAAWAIAGAFVLVLARALGRVAGLRRRKWVAA